VRLLSNESPLARWRGHTVFFDEWLDSADGVVIMEDENGTT
jgi:hypothetical protein